MTDKEYKNEICPVCGEVFQISKFFRWGWLIGSESNPKPVCSYKCQRDWEKDPSKKKKPQVKRCAVRIVETGEVFESISDCALHFHTSASALRHSIYEGRDYKGFHIERVVI